MEYFKKYIIKMAIIILTIIIGITSTYFLGNDNPVEEIAEKIIEEETGVNIDLTPKSIENQKN
jgi:hypothetical protein